MRQLPKPLYYKLKYYRRVKSEESVVQSLQKSADAFQSFQRLLTLPTPRVANGMILSESYSDAIMTVARMNKSLRGLLKLPLFRDAALAGVLKAVCRTIDTHIEHHRENINTYNEMRRQSPQPKIELFQTMLEEAYGQIAYAVDYAKRKLRELAQTLSAASSAA